MLVKAGLDPEKVSSQTVAPFDSVLTHAQVKTLEQGKPGKDALTSLAASLTLPDNKTITISVGERRILHPLKEVFEEPPAFIATTKVEEEDCQEPFINYPQHGRLLEDKAKKAEYGDS
ncbi:hypothetical protein Vadar_012670 [Vaccinium darrowii]|uniref:Uncharacterized protein n=1 Tax=Vaccinium darrowii TaxID=229202 RepID=A0ACB7YDI7_9ERIC|nr:hypothetical protein Vadar_012670 [Vaccinium darrowii]